MNKITIKLNRNISFYYNLPVYLSVYKTVDSYDLDLLSDDVVNKLAGGERSKIFTFVEGKDLFDIRIEAMRKAVIDAMIEKNKHLAGDAKIAAPTITEEVTVTKTIVEETPAVEPEPSVEEAPKVTTKRKTAVKKVEEAPVE